MRLLPSVLLLAALALGAPTGPAPVPELEPSPVNNTLATVPEIKDETTLVKEEPKEATVPEPVAEVDPVETKEEVIATSIATFVETVTRTEIHEITAAPTEAATEATVEEVILPVEAATEATVEEATVPVEEATVPKEKATVIEEEKKVEETEEATVPVEETTVVATEEKKSEDLVETTEPVDSGLTVPEPETTVPEATFTFTETKPEETNEEATVPELPLETATVLVDETKEKCDCKKEATVVEETVEPEATDVDVSEDSETEPVEEIVQATEAATEAPVEEATDAVQTTIETIYETVTRTIIHQVTPAPTEAATEAPLEEATDAPTEEEIIAAANANFDRLKKELADAKQKIADLQATPAADPQTIAEISGEVKQCTCDEADECRTESEAEMDSCFQSCDEHLQQYGNQTGKYRECFAKNNATILVAEDCFYKIKDGYCTNSTETNFITKPNYDHYANITHTSGTEMKDNIIWKRYEGKYNKLQNFFHCTKHCMHRKFLQCNSAKGCAVKISKTEDFADQMKSCTKKNIKITTAILNTCTCLAWTQGVKELQGSCVFLGNQYYVDRA